MHIPVFALKPLLEWLLTPDRPGGRAPIVKLVPFLLATIAIGAYAGFVSGRVTGSTVFLALSGATLLEASRLLYGAARSLFAEPPDEEVAVATGRRRKELEREKTSLLKAIKELEFDHEMRKVSDGDFAEIGGVYRARAIRVMRQLDDRQVDYVRLVEEELARSRAGQPRGVVAEPGAVVDAVVASPPLVLAGVCGSCAAKNDFDADFCKKCGTKMNTEAPKVSA